MMCAPSRAARARGAMPRTRSTTQRRTSRAVTVTKDASRRGAATANARAGSDEASMKPIVKVCGITTVRDCESACEHGANFVGMILWPKSKRSVDEATAKEIVACAKAKGAVPVAVFVDENASEITRVCDAIGCDHAQLHGDGARDVARDARGIGTSMGRARAIAGARDVGAGAAGERADRTGV